MGEKTFSSPEAAPSSNPTDPAHLAYLLGQINRLEFNRPRGQYPAPQVRPQRKAHAFSSEQRYSYEFLKTWAHTLSEGFTATELKKAFRQAAISLHPDQGGDAQQFVALKGHYDNLRSLCINTSR